MLTNSYIPDRTHEHLEKWLGSKHKEEEEEDIEKRDIDPVLGKRSHSDAFGTPEKN